MPRVTRVHLLIAGALVAAACAAVFLTWRGMTPQAEPGLQTAEPLPGGIRAPERPAVSGARLTNANVLIVTVDTLRRDHLAPYGAAFDTPAASRLAREGITFERAVSHVPLTLPSHTSLFTGLYPPQHAVRDNGGFTVSEGTTLLAERLRGAGYATAGFVSSYVLHSRWGIAQGHDVYDDLFDYAGLEDRALTDVERPAAPVVDAALKWVEGVRRGRKPFYLWIHVFDPHSPYEPPDEYRRRAPSAYAGEVMYADAEIARLLKGLDDMDVRRNTLVVYAADHGEALGEHGEPTHGIFLYGGSMDVPLLIAPPPGTGIGTPSLPLAGRRVKGLARLVDVAPTVLDLIGQPLPEDLDGASLLPIVMLEAGAADAVAAGDPADAIQGPVSYAETFYPRFHYNWSELVSVESLRWKFVSAPRPELYDRRTDPREAKNVAADHPAIVATLAQHLGSLTGRDAATPTPAKLDPDERARLEALGYVSSADVSGSRRGPRPDPKDGLPLLQELLEAQTARDAGRLDDALRRLQQLTRTDPDNPAVFITLSTVYDKRGDGDAAIRAARRAVALDPASSAAVLNLAFAFKGAGRADDAATGFERVLSLDPDNVKALLNLGEIRHAAGDRERAFEIYQRATKAAPRLARAWISLGAVALELNRSAVAEQALKEAVAQGGRQPDLHFNLGVLAEQRGQKAAALREYRAEVAAHPGSVGAWVNLGLLERESGRIDAALRAFEAAATARPDAMEGPYLMAETLAALGRRQEAARWAREALARSPQDSRVQQLVRRVGGTPPD